MGIGKTGLQLGKEIIAWTRTSGKSLLATRPIKNFNIKGLEYKGNISADICTFTSDRTLCPKFLNKLIEDLELLGGNTYKKLELIRTRILKGMGYNSSPELIKIKKTSGLENMTAGFSAYENSIIYGSGVEVLNNKELIAVIRHELDHFDKYAKTISCEGFESVQNAYSKILKLDKNFWTQFAKECRPDNFDSKKYLEAIKTYANSSAYNYQNAFQRLWAEHLYCINPLEVSAYKIQKQINNVLGIKKVVHPDCFGEPVKKLYDIMLQKGIPAKEFEKWYTIRLICRTQEGLTALKKQDIDLITKILSKNNNPDLEELPKIFDDIYNWFSKGEVDFSII